jgi:hypothetical protein
MSNNTTLLNHILPQEDGESEFNVSLLVED